MKDNELRGLILKKYYEKRRVRAFRWEDEDFNDLAEGIEFDSVDLFRICDQLAQHKLIQWEPVNTREGTISGHGKITAFGVDVVEGSTASPISITYDYRKTISVSNSNAVQVGDGNVQDLSVHIERIVSAIDHSTATEEQKAEAKSLLKKFLEHPIVAAIAGGIASNIKF